MATVRRMIGLVTTLVGVLMILLPSLLVSMMTTAVTAGTLLFSFYVQLAGVGLSVLGLLIFRR